MRASGDSPHSDNDAEFIGAPTAAKRPRRPLGRWIAVTALAVLLGLSLLLNALLAAGLAVKTALAGGRTGMEEPEDERPAFVERWSYGDGEAKAARIAVEGVIERSVHGGLLGLPSDPAGEIAPLASRHIDTLGTHPAQEQVAE